MMRRNGSMRCMKSNSFSLVIILALILGVATIPLLAYAASAGGDGLVVYNPTATATTFSWKYWDSSHSLGSASSVTHGMNAYAYHMTMVGNPNNASVLELMLLSASTGSQDTTEVKLFTFDNSSQSWDSGTTATTTAHDVARAGKIFLSADIDVEGTSGDALVVYTDSTDLLYRTKANGGSWSGATTLSAGDVSISIDLDCDPNSNNCLVVWSDDENSNYPVKASVWDGSSWGTITAMDSIGQYSNGEKELSRNVGAAWEGTSGDGMATWVDGNGDWRYNTYATSWGTSATISVFTGVGTVNKPAGISMAGDHNSNNIVMIAGDGNSKSAEVSIWNGAFWGTASTLCDGSTPQCDTSKMPTIDSTWSDASKAWVFVNPKSGNGIRYMTWDGGWSGASTVGSVVYKGGGVDVDSHFDTDRMWLTADDASNKDDYDYWYYTVSGGWSTATGVGASSTLGKPRPFAVAYFDGRNDVVTDAVPTSNSPADSTDQSTIGWILYDDIAAGYYRVYRNGTIQNDSTAWTNNTNLNVWVNQSKVGIWNYTIWFNDSVGNEGTPDTVYSNISTISRVVNNTSPACTTGATYYSLIQAAIDASSGNEVITVCDGSYQESADNVHINKIGLTIKSYNNWGASIVYASGTPTYLNLLTIEANNVTVWGMNLTYNGDNDLLNMTNNNDTMIRDNLLNVTGGTAKAIEDTVGGPDYNWTFWNNTIDKLGTGTCIGPISSNNQNWSENTMNCNDLRFYVEWDMTHSEGYIYIINNYIAGSPVWLETADLPTDGETWLKFNNNTLISEFEFDNYNYANGVPIRYVEFMNNTITMNANGDQIKFYEPPVNLTMSGNVISNPDYKTFTYGIWFRDCYNCSVFNNTITDMAYGIYAGQTASIGNLNISNNTIYNSTTASIIIGSTVPDGEVRIWNNNLTKNSGGSDLSYSGGNSFEWNTTFSASSNIINSTAVGHGGNYWGKTDGTGYSDLCADSGGDDICDDAYNISTGTSCTPGSDCGLNTDFLPLWGGTSPAADATFRISMPSDYTSWMVIGGTTEGTATATDWLSFNFTDIPQNMAQPYQNGSASWTQSGSQQPIFYIDNTGNVNINISLRFSSSLPTGLVVMANASCSGTYASCQSTIQNIQTSYVSLAEDLSQTASFANITLFSNVSAGTAPTGASSILYIRGQN